MKKTNLLLAALALSAATTAQTVIYNGENEGVGMWDEFLIPSREVDNPQKDAVNGSNRCLEMTRLKTVDPWSGARAPRLNIQNPTDYGSITIMVRKNYPGLVKLEIQTAGEARKEFIEAHYDGAKLGQWQKLTFILPPNALNNEPLAIILAQIHSVDTKNDDDYYDDYMYLDEIILQPKNASADFNGETKGVGMWVPFLTDVAEVNNPQKDATNGSDRCLWINRKKNIEEWAGTRAPMLKVTNLSDYNAITMMVKKNVAGTVQMELQTRDEGKKEFLTAEYDGEKLGQWQKLTFQLPENALQGEPLSIILLSPHRVNTIENPAAVDQDVYVDEIYFDQLSSESLISEEKGEIVTTALYTIRGEKVNGKLSDSDLPNGVYLLEEINIQNKRFVTKIVK